jgi:hypothetical protein
VPSFLILPEILQTDDLVALVPSRLLRENNDGVFAAMPPGRLIPTKTRLFVEEISNAIKAGWARN